MPCPAEELRHVPLFSLLDDEELEVLSQQVELRTFAARQRIYKAGDPSNAAYIMLAGKVEVFTVDANQQDVLVDEPGHGEFFGFASMIEQTAHQTSAVATEDSSCVEVDRNDIAALLERKPMAGMDMMTVIARQSHALQHLVRERASRNANTLIDEEFTFGERIADHVASFGGSWTFIILFAIVLIVYTATNVALGNKRAWDPYPFILLNLFLSMLAAIQAPVIMMSQNRQDKKDRLRGELDFDVNVRAESEIQELSRKLNILTDKIDDVDELLRGSVGRS
jgi:CRP/FNR family cyclic AMP-dependent transcriptional regulator